MFELNLYDNCIGGSDSVTACITPKHIKYLRGSSRTAKYSIYTNQDAYGPITTPPETSFALLYESPEIMPHLFIYAKQLTSKFKYIFTHSRQLCQSDPERIKWVPSSGPWIGGDANGPGGGKIEIAPKTKLASMLLSDKNWTRGHKVRHQVAEQLKEHPNVDIFKNAGIRHTYDAIAPYCFTFVVENGFSPGYFTEKLLDCIAVGTVPVYLGDPAVGEVFDPRGIINLRDVMDGTVKLTKDLFDSMDEYRRDNFITLGQDFQCPEDYMWKEYLWDLEP